MRAGGQVRETIWISLPDIATSLASGVAVLTGVLNAAALALRPFTIVRTHVTWQLRSDQEAADESYGASIGFAIVSEQASAIGVTAIPTPITDRGSDLFFLYDIGFGRMANATAVGFTDVGVLQKVDSKAMRKVNDDQDLVIVAENSGASTNGVVVTCGGRMLLKLH